MNDKDKVISGLEHCSEDGCKGCPYEQDCKMCDGFSLLAKDALELINYQHEHIEAFLKDQEPTRVESVDYGTDLFKRYRCPTCKVFFDHKHNYCPICGKKVKWDE